jgi:hypothetical protein
LLGSNSANTPIAHVMAGTGTHAMTEELLEALFSVRSVPRLYNEDQLPLEQSLETPVRRV